VEQVLRSVVAIDATLPVILDVAGDVPLGDMIEVYDLSRLAGFERIQFAARAR
jgi:biopolymer transport protein ExbD